MQETHQDAIIELGILARTPEHGQVKQRLAREIGHDKTLEIYRKLFRHTLLCAIHAHKIRPSLRPVLWYQGSDPTSALPAEFRFDIRPQPGTDFAVNMQTVIDRVNAPGVSGAIIIGSDHPGLCPEHLLELASLLETAKVCLGATEDGGFWGMGTRVPLNGIYSNMTFSTPTVCRELEQRLDARNLCRARGQTLFDIDTAADLSRAENFSLLR